MPTTAGVPRTVDEGIGFSPIIRLPDSIRRSKWINLEFIDAY